MTAVATICVTSGLLAEIVAGRTLSLALGLGLIAIFMLLAILVWTRWGQAKPISKCIVLSLLAHLLLLIYGYSTHILSGPPGRWNGQAVTMRIRDASDPIEAAPVKSQSPKPWNQAGETNAPLLLANAENKQAEPEPEPASPAAEPSPATIASEPIAKTAAEVTAQPADAPKQPMQQPQLTDLLPDQGPDKSTVAAQEAATASPPPVVAHEVQSPPPALDANGNGPLPGAADDSHFVTATRRAVARRLGDGQAVPEPLQARVASNRLQAAQPFGATAQTESAVAAALDWLAANQSPDGRWDADLHGAGRETRNILGHDRRDPKTGRMTGTQADTGITGLALLAFLGSGETHLSGKHRQNVQLGLEFLLGEQSNDGSLAGQAELFAAMYCHGMASLAVAEAYALSGDDRLLPGLKRALEFTIAAQHSTGSWRYRPSEPGDMSQFGWQLMALKSADLGGLPMPIATRVRMVRFLQSCSIGNKRGLAGYRPGDRASRTMTAEALVCRYFLESENSPAALNEGTAYVIEERPSRQSPNYYYWYYGTLAMFQRQGVEWQRWNAALQTELLARQRWDGAAAGSYDPDDLWGGYGGRVYSTALATLSLEVYYRYLPIHGRDLDDSRLTDRPGQPAVSR